jgi:CHAT domain-containing protein/Flp pilus assembly protein TadD
MPTLTVGQRISRAGLAIFIAVAMICSADPARTPRLGVALHAQDATQLASGATIERDMAAGESHMYRLTLAAGDFVRITVAHKGVDLGVTLVRPDGRALVALPISTNEFRPRTIVAVADVQGVHTIGLSRGALSEPLGHYAIRVDEVRPTEPLDDTRIEARRALERGTAHLIVPTPRPRDALGEFSRALDCYRQLNDRRGELEAQLEVATMQSALLVPEALASSQRADQLARELQDRLAMAEAARTLGLAYDRTGDLTAALRAFKAFTAASRALGFRRSESIALNHEGIVRGRTGDSEQAVAQFERALRLARPAEDSYYNALNNLGIAYKDLGQYEKALDAYERSLTVVRARADRASEAVILNNMGNLQRLLGNHQTALDLHTSALALSRELGRQETEARSLSTIGSTYYALGEYAKALDYQRESLTIRRKLADLPGQAASLDGAGRASHRLGEREQALDALREALTIRRTLRETLGESDTLRNLAAVERDGGNLAEALRYAEAAVDLDEAVRERITSPELRATYAAAEHSTYELFVDVLQRSHAVNPTGGYSAVALHASERARARVLLESLLDARVDLRQGIDPALLERDRSLQKQLNEASGQLSRLLARTAANDQSSTAAQKLEWLTAEYQEVQAQIRQQSPRYAAVMQPRPLTAIEIQQSVIDDDTVLLEFALGEERSWLWAVTPDTLTSVELPPRREIDAATRSLYELLTARQKRGGENSSAHGTRVSAADARLADQAAAVSRMLLGGITRQLAEEWRNKRLAIVAGGALEYVPFAALPSPASTARLMSQHEIVMLPSASVLAVLRREAAGRAPAPHALAILADPVFDATDPRVTARRSAVPSSVNDETASRAIDVVDALYGRSGLSRLPFSREEAKAIAALAGPTEVLTAIDFKASRATVVGGALSGHRIVHFATHGVLDGEHPSLSSLILSLVDEHGARQNGYLRLHDIYNMRLDADLVVLSACQTALGKEIKGEGLIGLTRAFIHAGAPRVVASLWQVSDLATAELMKTFYRSMLQQHLRPAAALRAAQLQMSRDPRWASPYFWAGFVLQGEYR